VGVTTFADVWALGVALYTMLVGADPFLGQGDNEDVVLERILSASLLKKHPKYESLEANCRELLDQLFVVDEAKRPPCNRVLVHPWVLLGKPTLAAADAKSEEDALAVYSVEILRLMELFAALHPLQQLLLILCARIPFSSELRVFGLQQGSGEAAAAIPWHALFSYLDTDRDGKLGIGELRRGLSPFAGPDLRNWLSVLDNDGSGAIDWAEWSALALLEAGRQDCLTKEVDLIGALARLLDTPTGDGCITEEDLAVLLPAASAAPKHRAITVWITECSSEASKASSTPSLSLEDVRRLLSSEELCSRMRDSRRKI
jgi:hypothetical protein